MLIFLRGLKNSPWVFLSCLFFFLSPPAVRAEGEEVNLGFVEAELERRALPYEKHALFTGEGGAKSSLVLRMGSGDAGGGQCIFVLAVPLSSSRYGLEAALAFAEKFSRQNRGIAAFLGDESSPDHRGLLDLIAGAEDSENWILCYLDINPPLSGLGLYRNGGGYRAPLEIVKPFYRLGASRIPLNFGEKTYPPASSVLKHLGEEGIEGFYLSNFPAPPETPEQREGTPPSGAETLGALLAEYGGLELSAKDPDRRYLILPLPGADALFIPQEVLVTLLIISGAVFIFLAAGYFPVFKRAAALVLPLLVLSFMGAAIFFLILTSAFPA
ncbi:MAG: hypothetical protein LBL43_05185 [Treponema sp.]|jgi:hypothetical protein|nr:hypothetical protein [Treponema sp.]